MEAHKGKYDIMLPFKYDVGETLLDVKAQDQVSDAVVVITAGNIGRKEIFQKQCKFTGSLTEEYHYDKPASLTVLDQMILGGTNIQTQTENNHVVKTADLPIFDLLTFIAVRCSRRESISTHTRHRMKKRN